MVLELLGVQGAKFARCLPGAIFGNPLIPVLLLLCLTGPAVAQAHRPQYEERDCRDYVPWLLDAAPAATRCGVLRVPENRDDAARGRMLALFVLRIPAQTDMGKPPVVYLEGGPGGAASASAIDLLDSALRQENELILIDQRGTGLSTPSLNCPEMDDAGDAGDYSSVLQNCRNRLLVEGIDLRAYSSAYSAWDAHDLLVALNIDAANIYGISYGSQLALTFARDFPERLRALVLDGVSPPQARIVSEQAANGQAAFERLFADCAASAACASAYPNLRGMFHATADALDESPAVILDWHSNEERDMDGADWINYLFDLFYDSDALPYMPAFIAAHAAGDYFHDPAPVAADDQPADWTDTPIGFDDLDDDSEGMYFSVVCADSVPFDSAEAALAAGEKLPPRLDAALTSAAIGLLDDCYLWNVPASHPRENNVVHSDIPTLLLSGAYDPITPPAWGTLAARALSHSWHYIFPAAGHGVLGSHACADALLRAFLDDPTARPDDDCVAALRPPDFHLP